MPWKQQRRQERSRIQHSRLKLVREDRETRMAERQRQLQVLQEEQQLQRVREER